MGMNCQILDKSISSLSTINKITDHDMKSMGSGGLGMQASHDYIGPENKEYMKDKIAEINPFSTTRPRITLLDKSQGLSPFTGMTSERVSQFTKRNKSNLKRNFPAKVVLSNSISMIRTRENQSDQSSSGHQTTEGDRELFARGIDMEIAGVTDSELLAGGTDRDVVDIAREYQRMCSEGRQTWA